MPSSSPSPQRALAALLEQHQPSRLLLVGNSPLPTITAYCQAHAQAELVHCPASARLPETLASQRYDLAIVVDCLEHLSPAQGRQLLGSIRNLNSSRLAVLVDLQASGWTPTDFYALAMQASDSFLREKQTLSLFTYDLLAYKQAPDWLNAKFWANPENFGKYWW